MAGRVQATVGSRSSARWQPLLPCAGTTAPAPAGATLVLIRATSASQARDLHALLRAARVPPPYVLVGESSAALDARVYSGFYPSEVAGLVLVNWADPALFLDLRSSNGKRAERIPQLIYHSQDAVAQLFNWVGLYRLGPVPPAPAPPKGLTAAEWNTIWFLTHSSKAISALMQDIASWRLSSAEARAAGSLGGRPLLVLSAGNIAAPPEFLEAWTNAQSDLARLSTRGRQIAVGGGAERPPVRCARCHRRGRAPGCRRGAGA